MARPIKQENAVGPMKTGNCSQAGNDRKYGKSQ
jgi:hypothetical protein